MRFVVATSAPRYWLPQIQSIAEALGARGHQAIAITYDSIDEGKKFAADVLFCLGTHQSPQPFLDAALAPTKILYLIESVPTPSEGDDFTRLKLDAHRDSLPRFDHVFVHTPRSIPVIAGLGARAVETLYWPHFPNLFYPLPGAEKEIDVLFVGNLSPHRHEVLEMAAAKFKVGHCVDIYHTDSTEVYARAKIALNIHATPLKNFECRVTEVLGCGAFLLTEALDPDDVLIDGQHLVAFDNQNLLELLDRYLNDAPARERIARAGHAEIHKYTLDKQIERVIAVAETARAAGASPASEPLKPASISAGSNAGNPSGGTDSGPAAVLAAGFERSIKLNNRIYVIKSPKLNAIDYMIDEIFVQKIYPFFPFLSSLSGVILDVGANIGCASILFRAWHPTTPIFAFEPARETYTFLQANTASLPDIRLFNYGLLDRDATARLYLGRDNSTTNSLSPNFQNTDQTEEIVLRRVSNVLAEQAIEQIAILKIDTEGAEVPILQDIEHRLDRVHAIFLEYHSERDRREIDQMLAERFLLCQCDAKFPHRGTVAYLAKNVARAYTTLQKFEIPRPSV